MSERVKCKRCDAMILVVTAKVNDGLCGHCICDKSKADFDAIVKGWIDDPSMLPGTRGIREPEDLALRIAARRIRRRLYPSKEEQIENFCRDYFQAAHTKWTMQGSSSLSVKQKHSLAIETFYGEVLNEGLVQYLGNESGSFAQWADEAFDAIGLPFNAAMIRNVKALFPNGQIPEDPNKRLDIVESLGREELEVLEESFWERYECQKNEISALMHAYLRDLEQDDGGQSTTRPESNDHRDYNP